MVNRRTYIIIHMIGAPNEMIKKNQDTKNLVQGGDIYLRHTG